MLRILFYFLLVAAAAYGISYLDEFGTVSIDWGAGSIQPKLWHVLIALLGLIATVMFIWGLLRGIFSAPQSMSNFFSRRRKEQGVEALSSGLIAIGSGDKALASRYASMAKRKAPNEPMTQIIRAQAAQLAGDHKTAKRIYESMLASRDTELIGLRGLYLEALEAKELDLARQYAARAVRLRADLPWAVKGLFDLQCGSAKWEEALQTLVTASNNRIFDKKQIKRYRAVILTARAMELEEKDSEKALKLALEAHGLAPALVPAAEIAGRLAASEGKVGQANRIVTKTWKQAPHPDLAVISAFARTGDSPRDRLARVKSLAKSTPGHREAQIAIASAAVDARDWAMARQALEPVAKNTPTKRICALMARIEGATGDKGRVREWLARAVHAPQDAIWTADGVVSEEWAPTSPVTGKLDAFEWKVPVETVGLSAEQHRLETLLASTGLVESIGAEKAEAIDVSPVAIEAKRKEGEAGEPMMKDITMEDSAQQKKTEKKEVIQVSAATSKPDDSKKPETPKVIDVEVKIKKSTKPQIIPPKKTNGSTNGSSNGSKEPELKKFSKPYKRKTLAESRKKNIAPRSAPDDPGPDGFEFEDR